MRYEDIFIIFTIKNIIYSIIFSTFATEMKKRGFILAFMIVLLALVAGAQEAREVHVDTIEYNSILMRIDSLSQLTKAETEIIADTITHKSKFQRLKESIKKRIDDKMSEPYDTTRNSGYWLRALKHGKIDLNDESIGYPKFIKFCWKVYKWGDKAFNSYDSTYVVGTGKNWKLFLKNNYWMDSYRGKLNDGVEMKMFSKLSTNIGATLAFMAVSLGYTLDISNLVNGEKVSKKAELSFTCARFTADAYYMENTGSTTMYYKQKSSGHEEKINRFGGLKREIFGLNAYYFFNNRRYAQAAAYCFSKYQKRSAGSFLAGISMLHHVMDVDVNEIPEQIRNSLPEDFRPRFVCNDYCLLVGYGHNWVIKKNWLINLTVTPYFGYRHLVVAQNSEDVNKWSLNVRGRFGVVYNLKKYFFALQGYADAHGFKTSNRNIISSIEDLSLIAGIRF